MDRATFSYPASSWLMVAKILHKACEECVKSDHVNETSISILARTYGGLCRCRVVVLRASSGAGPTARRADGHVDDAT